MKLFELLLRRAEFCTVESCHFACAFAFALALAIPIGGSGRCGILSRSGGEMCRKR